MDDVDAAVIAAAEEHVRTSLRTAVQPRPNDCLACYLHRALPWHGCDRKLTLTHAWQGHQRVLRRRTGGRSPSSRTEAATATARWRPRTSSTTRAGRAAARP